MDSEILQNIHTLPINFKKHAALMLLLRFELSLDEVKHYIKTAKYSNLLKRMGTSGFCKALSAT